MVAHPHIQRGRQAVFNSLSAITMKLIRGKEKPRTNKDTSSLYADRYIRLHLTGLINILNLSSPESSFNFPLIFFNLKFKYATIYVDIYE